MKNVYVKNAIVVTNAYVMEQLVNVMDVMKITNVAVVMIAKTKNVIVENLVNVKIAAMRII